MSWTVRYTSDAVRQIRKLGPQTEARLRKYLHEHVETLDNPRSVGQALAGSRLGHFWRYRVGDYRIICDILDDDLIILVVEVGHRREIYR